MLPLEKCLACGNLYSIGPAGVSPACPSCGAATASSAAATLDQVPPFYQQWLDSSTRPEVRAKERAKVPAVCLMLWGIAWIIAGLIAMGIGVAAGVDGNDPILAVIIFELVGLFLILSGVLVLLGGIFLRRLRRYRLVLTAIVYGMVVGVVVCFPLSLLGIWPLTIVLNKNVKLAFG